MRRNMTFHGVVEILWGDPLVALFILPFFSLLLGLWFWWSGMGVSTPVGVEAGSLTFSR